MVDSPDFDIGTAENLRGVPHGFFGSGGGAHQFGFGGPGDAAGIARLRAQAADAIFSGSALVAPHQVHSPDVISVTQGWADTEKGRPVADALVTKVRGLALGIVTADCTPVLFADVQAGVIGAAHAGWRGAARGVLEETVAAMVDLGASRQSIRAAIGPTIAQDSYEVDEPFKSNFSSRDDRYFAPAPQREGKARWHFDLPGYVHEKLTNCGVNVVFDVRQDTFSQEKRYFSYRRASQRGEPDYGRQISIIALP